MILRATKTENGVLADTIPFNYEFKADTVIEFSKQPAERFPVTIDLTNRLPTAITISSCTVAAIDLTTLGDATSTVLLSGTATVSGGKVTGVVRAGTSGRTYKVTFTATLSDSSILEEDIQMDVLAI